ncbi:cell wall-binding repeat-containing protein [Clostridium sp. PL3]|uniref:Cell wall-binding repeat-containing protein n=1 Tax=Clostridium thailandense TaxID=2794346 RepID=A0A949WR07_9CLOT|nr:cell wall-binding repeat-containing protein [Clostridium thailandense]MBV7273411.1 cell wall-binding repeat-containing protein [Clostridium thailandense]
MNKRSKKGLASLLFIPLALSTLALNTVHAEQSKVIRMGETDRYATAAKVAITNWNTSDSVILVSGEGYADAVSASVLAKKLNAPILLTTAETLNSDTKSAMIALKVKNVYVVGGKASISQWIRDELKNSNYNLIELQGANRYETNVAVAKQLVKLGVKADTLMLAGGEGFSDALSAAPIAAAKEEILLLGNNDDESMKSVIEFIKSNNSKVTILGTKNVINDTMYNKLDAVERVDGGIDRFETNRNVLEKFGSELKDGQIFVANASGQGYADALVAAALAGKAAAPLVLLDTTSSEATRKSLDYIKGKSAKTTGINIIGGTGVVSKETEDALNSAVANSDQVAPTEEATIKSIEMINLNQIKVEFNTAVDHNSAVDVTNYEINGTKLIPCSGLSNIPKDINAACVYYADPYNSYITLAHPRKQYDKLTFTVRNTILNTDKTKTVEGLSKDLTLSDTAVPTLKNIVMDGNNELRVEFSEAINFKSLKELKNKVKLDGKNLDDYGIDEAYTAFNDGMTVQDSSYEPVGIWGNRVSFYLNTPIPTGNHTLKVLDGDNNGLLNDAAGFIFKESSMDFKVDTNNTEPVVKSITHPEGGQIFILFDKSMDMKSAPDLSNYELNGKKLSEVPGIIAFNAEPFFDLVKIFYVPENLFNNGSNVVYISDNVKDAYGNKVAEDTRIAFTNAVDNAKPTVNSVNIIDSETIRIEYSKVVDYSYATSKSNYKLLDSKGIDITSHIKAIVNSSGTTSSDNGNTFDIKLNKYNSDDSNDDWRLNSSRYILTIKNIIDTATKANTMDEYTTTLNGSDGIAPKVTGTYAKIRSTSSEKDKVVVYFNEAMDSSALTNRGNYKFINGEGETKSLPEDTSITAGGDDKSAIVEFPSSYNVKTTGKTTTGTSNDVTALIVSNVKDEAGNELDSVAYTGIIGEMQVGAKVKVNTVKVYYAGDDLKVDVQFDKAIDTIQASDFTLGGVTPSSASISGDKITLTYKDGELASAADKQAAPIITFANGKTNNDANTKKIDLIKSQGQSALLGIKAAAQTTDETGTSIANLDDKTGNNQNTIYDYEAAPRTTCTDDTSVDFWTAEKDVNGTKVYITFDTPLDVNSGIKSDDFAFTGSNGTDIKADSAEIKGNTLIFNFDPTNKDYDNALKNSAEIAVRAKSTVSLRTIKDADGNNSNYKPSENDLKKRTIIVTNR